MLPNSYQFKLNWDNLFLNMYKVSIYEIPISYIRVDLNQKKKYIVLIKPSSDIRDECGSLFNSTSFSISLRVTTTLYI